MPRQTASSRDTAPSTSDIVSWDVPHPGRLGSLLASDTTKNGGWLFCYVEGNVDYVWGKGTAYFDTCELKTITRAGYDVQARNDQSHMGYVLVNTKLTADAGVSGHYLGRIAAASYPYSQVAYINCMMGPHIAAAGWLLTDTVAADASHRQFWEYQTKDLSGNPVDVTQRLAPSRQLTVTEASQLSDPCYVLGGWTPRP